MTYGQKAKKYIKQYMKPFAKQHGFSFLKPTVLIRIKPDILHAIHFELTGTPGFYCSAIIQPLYIPCERINLSFGDRLRHISNNREAWWLSGDESDLGEEFEELLQVLTIKALPWFDYAGSPRGIVSYINNWVPGDPFLIAPVIRKRYLAYSYLYLNELGLADQTFLSMIADKKVFLEASTQRFTSIEKDIEALQALRMQISENPETVNQKVQEFIEYSISNLKITNK